MKNLTKIIALIAIAALAAISCAPEAEVSSYDWSANQDFDLNLAGPTTDATGTAALPNALAYVSHLETDTWPTAGNKVTTYSKIQFSLAFGNKADVLRADDIGAELGKFLTFYKIVRSDKDKDGNTVAVQSNAPVTGNTDTLSSAISYTFVRRSGSTIVVELSTTYSSHDGVSGPNQANAVEQSQIVAKIDGSQFTYARGLKVDRDNNGIAGEAGYDDLWLIHTTTGGNPTSYGATAYNGVALPTVQNWFFTLSGVAASTWLNSTSTTTEVKDITAATLTANDGNPTTVQQNAIKQAFAGSFKLQKYVGGTWTDAASAVLTPGPTDSDPATIQFTAVTYDHLVPYRIVWKGSEDPKYTTSLFGLQQRIDIRGKDNSSGDRRPYFRQQTQINGEVATFNNTGVKNFIFGNSDPNITVYSNTHDDKNVVLELQVNVIQKPVYDTDGITQQTDANGQLVNTYYGLKEIDLAAFKESFKVLYNSANRSSNDPLAGQLTEVDIIKIEFAKKTSTAIARSVNDVVRITLDPNYTKNTTGYTFVLVDSGLGYTDNINVFGSTGGALWGFKNAHKYNTF